MLIDYDKIAETLVALAEELQQIRLGKKRNVSDAQTHHYRHETACCIAKIKVALDIVESVFQTENRRAICTILAVETTCRTDKELASGTWKELVKYQLSTFLQSIEREQYRAHEYNRCRSEILELPDWLAPITMKYAEAQGKNQIEDAFYPVSDMFARQIAIMESWGNALVRLFYAVVAQIQKGELVTENDVKQRYADAIPAWVKK